MLFYSCSLAFFWLFLLSIQHCETIFVCNCICNTNGPTERNSSAEECKPVTEKIQRNKVWIKEDLERKLMGEEDGESKNNKKMNVWHIQFKVIWENVWVNRTIRLECARSGKDEQEWEDNKMNKKKMQHQQKMEKNAWILNCWQSIQILKLKRFECKFYCIHLMCHLLVSYIFSVKIVRILSELTHTHTSTRLVWSEFAYVVYSRYSCAHTISLSLSPFPFNECRRVDGEFLIRTVCMADICIRKILKIF